MKPSSLALVLCLSAGLAAAGEPTAADEAPPPVVYTGDYVPAKLIKKVDARPPKFGRVGFQGSTMRVCFTIAVDGTTKDVNFPGLRDNEFESSIRHALIRWRFEPATLDGVPVEQKSCVDFQIKAIGG